MLPLTHIISGLILSVFLFIFLPFVNLFEAAIVFFASFLIDTDHYLYYVFNKRDLNPRRAVHWFKEKRKKYLSTPKGERHLLNVAIIFHGFEILGIVFALGYFVNTIFFYVFIGMFLHLTLDLIEQFRVGEFTKISIVYDFIKFKRLNK